jgi:hypothetical protein
MSKNSKLLFMQMLNFLLRDISIDISIDKSLRTFCQIGEAAAAALSRLVVKSLKIHIHTQRLLEKESCTLRYQSNHDEEDIDSLHLS